MRRAQTTRRLIGYALGVALAGPLFLASVPAALAQQPLESKVGLVVQFAEGDVVTECVTLPPGPANGLDVLAASSLPSLAHGSSMGVMVCKIQDTGCNAPAEDCFCRCQGINCAYWNYLRRPAESDAGRWQYSQLGAAMVAVQPGDVEGWAWGDTGVGLPPITFAEICPAPTVPTATPSPSPAPLPTAEPETLARVTPPAAASPTVPLPTPTPLPSPVPAALATRPPTQNYLLVGAMAVIFSALVAFIRARR
ncbi:MAG: hypothetical protein ACE5G8_17025 [Anaerolineae bacterium]